MSVTLELKPEVEEAARARAKARGLSLQDYLQAHIETTMPGQDTPTDQEMAEFDADLDALVHGGEKATPQPNEALRRAYMYGEE